MIDYIFVGLVVAAQFLCISIIYEKLIKRK